jgi:phosphoglycolate phosphatase-like HAD superfamily hydrolase
MQVIAFDFDGVLCNSAREVFLVAGNAYAFQEPDSPLLEHLFELRENVAGGGTDFLDDPLVQAFSDLHPLGNRAEDFGVALCALDAGISIENQAAYDEFYSTLDPAWLASYHRRFYEARAFLRNLDPEAWLRLHTPYAGLGKTLRRRSDSARLAVATAKDATSAHLLLDELGLADLFDPAMVLDKETGVEKTIHLTALRERAGVEFGDITFVDDKVNHLQRVAHLGVRPILAGWGFNTPREHRLAERLGLEIASLDNVEAVLFRGD